MSLVAKALTPALSDFVLTIVTGRRPAALIDFHGRYSAAEAYLPSPELLAMSRCTRHRHSLQQ